MAVPIDHAAQAAVSDRGGLGPARRGLPVPGGEGPTRGRRFAGERQRAEQGDRSGHRLDRAAEPAVEHAPAVAMADEFEDEQEQELVEHLDMIGRS